MDTHSGIHFLIIAQALNQRPSVAWTEFLPWQKGRANNLLRRRSAAGGGWSEAVSSGRNTRNSERTTARDGFVDVAKGIDQLLQLCTIFKERQFPHIFKSFLRNQKKRYDVSDLRVMSPKVDLRKIFVTVFVDNGKLI